MVLNPGTEGTADWLDTVDIVGMCMGIVGMVMLPTNGGTVGMVILDMSPTKGLAMLPWNGAPGVAGYCGMLMLVGILVGRFVGTVEEAAEGTVEGTEAAPGACTSGLGDWFAGDGLAGDGDGSTEIVLEPAPEADCERPDSEPVS